MPDLAAQKLDNTFGPRAVYEKRLPARSRARLRALLRLQFFGHVTIDGLTEVIDVTLKDVDRSRPLVDPDRAKPIMVGRIRHPVGKMCPAIGLSLFAVHTCVSRHPCMGVGCQD